MMLKVPIAKRMLQQHVQPAQELLKNLVSLQCYLFLPVFSLAGYFYVSKSLLQFWSGGLRIFVGN